MAQDLTMPLVWLVSAQLPLSPKIDSEKSQDDLSLKTRKGQRSALSGPHRRSHRVDRDRREVEHDPGDPEFHGYGIDFICI